MALRTLSRAAARGFTLMELMIVLAVAAVILAIGAPNFRDFRMNNCADGRGQRLPRFPAARPHGSRQTSEHRLDLSLGRIRAAASSRRCDGDDFSGWIVFEDPDGDCDRTAAEPLIRGEGPHDASLDAPANGVCASFSRAGFARELPDGILADRLLFCDQRGTALQEGTTQSLARGIILDRTGRAQITRDQAIIESWGLSCGE